MAKLDIPRMRKEAGLSPVPGRTPVTKVRKLTRIRPSTTLRLRAIVPTSPWHRWRRGEWSMQKAIVESHDPADLELVRT